MAKVLIVDDSVFMRKMIKKILLNNNYTVVGEAENGQAALEKYKELKPDIVTLDITMGVINGIDALKNIINHDKKAKVVMVSSMGQSHFVQEAVQHGAKGFIIKPFKEDNVIKTLQNL